MIHLKGVRKVYPVKGGNQVVALDSVSLDVERGTIHGIVGQSGAGKSTLIRCLTALERPTEGVITVDGTDLSTLRGKELLQARRRIGMVFQAANLLDGRTALHNIAYPLKLAGVARAEREARAQELLDMVGLSGRGDSYPSQLSGGQRQRIGIARALADSPAVLLCDEPTSALDSESTRQILDLIRRIRHSEGVTVLVITHEMSVVRDLCDSVTLLGQGRILQSGRVEDVITEPSSPLARELVPLPNIADASVPQAMTVLDVMFTSRPGVPTGANVLHLAASMGADVTGGTFESMGTAQVGRMALSVPTIHKEAIIAQLQANNCHAEERRA
ncbi:ATP-binding cassette domain-containing protein [Schaalia sp. 19OD2882]|uniref:methionine ABC transporter ATP-binding protein n=1 Tax=Schaalia sp. 19OD2882 TaxID=2794089 RepID=UPI001C1ED63A|nr:methionine ABC transporter ATP-binding protein [Schaalia sp. 19OD2882]QWW19422.1 ATP-binding cassette domain-containing protein [Schaalia sp. 19OD2882]